MASLVWEKFGKLDTYVEPFFGSGAVLLGNPCWENTVETVNDACAWLTNFWRALQADPAGVARYADYPVSELDLHSRGDWLFYRPDAQAFVERLRSDPDYYDVKSAGWWVWGLCCWIGSGWGPRDAGVGVHRKLPHLGDAGVGVHRKLPHLGDAGRGINREDDLLAYFETLAARLRRVRICCGDWKRVTGPSVTTYHGLTGVFLDPPYSDKARSANLYSEDSFSVAHDVREWAIAHGDDPLMRIAICGYIGEYEMPASWDCVAWNAGMGYAGQGDGSNENGRKERIWFSRHCLTTGLFTVDDFAENSLDGKNIGK